MSTGFLQFCGTPFLSPHEEELNISLVSNITERDPGLMFTGCFQNTMLVWAPCAYLIAVSPFYFWHLVMCKNDVISLNWINLTKLTAGVALMLLCSVTMFQRVHVHHAIGTLYPAVLLAPALNFIATTLATVLIEFGRRRGIRVAGVLFTYWLIQTVAGSLTLYTVIQMFKKEGTGSYDVAQSSLFLLLVFTELIFSCLVDSTPYSSLYIQNQQKQLKIFYLQRNSPERSASFLSVITFWWFTSLIILGYKKPLERSDLWSLSAEDTSEYVSLRFEKYWKKEIEKINRRKNILISESESKSSEVDIPLRCTEGNVKPKDGSERVKKSLKPSLIIALSKAFGLTFLFGSFLKFVHDVLIFVSPMLLRELIAFASDKSQPLWKGYYYTVLLLVVALIQSLILNQYFHICFLTGMRLRTSVIAAVYRKSLKLSNAARRVSTVGEIVNLMSVDAQRFTELTTYLNLLWSGPFQICVALYFLWLMLGPSVLAGVAVMLILLPINGVIAKKNRTLQVADMGKVPIRDEVLIFFLQLWPHILHISGIAGDKGAYFATTDSLSIWALESSNMVLQASEVLWVVSGQQMVYKDNRIKLLSEILNGIKVLKLYAWEESFEKMILDIRKKELHVMRKAALLNAASSFAWACAPFLVSLVTFAAYVLSSPEHVLDAQKAFVSLSLFNILRFPLAMFPSMIGTIVQVSVSVERLRTFLLHEELDPDTIQRVNTGNYSLSIIDGSFTWNMSDKKPTLQDINISVQEGQLVAVVGVVGSGKSSLLSAFLGEMEKLHGKGSIAYTAQEAWIQNASLRDNIVFGQPFNEQAYEDVLEACGLTSDLDVLPGGDMTEIGEKGINLSGGQKQRVSLGRAVYQDANIYLMDDPLSAVDSHVGKHIFDRVIGPKGLLADKTRILVTHGISFLPQVDNILVVVDGRISEHGTYKDLLMKGGAFADFLKVYLAELEESDGEEDDEDIALREEILSHLSTSTKAVSTLSDSKEGITGPHQNTSKSMSSTANSPFVRHRRTATHSLSNNDTPDSSNKPSHDESDEETEREKSIANGKPTYDHQKLIKTEQSAKGQVKLSLFFLYLRSMKVPVCVAMFLLYALQSAIDLVTSFWLSAWSNDQLVNGTVDTALRDLRLGVFGSLGMLQALIILGASFALAFGAVFASSHLHNSLLHNILRLPMTFFDVTPSGRIVNRFSKDIDTIDTIISDVLESWMDCLLRVGETLIIISYSTPIFIAVIIPIGIFYFIIQRFYVAVSRQLKRLESVVRSPIYSHFGETIQGTSTIRAFQRQVDFIQTSDHAVDGHQEYYYPSIVSNRWLAVRLELVSNLIVLFASLFSVIGRDHLTPGIVGLSVTYAMRITLNLNWVVRMTSELETNIVSIERVKEYTNAPTEAAWEIPEKRPPNDWPQNGEIKFTDYSTRYREGLDLVLKGISCHIHPEEKIGIVGRTGAGKSSLTMALFRIIEATSGEISIDGLNISDIGLHDVRTKITIIPQDPVLFSGSLRMNLDPFNHHTDDELWIALEHAHLKSFVLSQAEQLEYACAEGGENLSLGQRQLVCLARALLRKTKVLILDEATAAVDLETDDLIQHTVRTEFKDCTVMTIAHRINTIMDYDRVMVLDAGKIAEIDSPQMLLADRSSIFYGLAKDAGLVDE
ncbi:hypothetical protein LSH36_1034g00008 [Paralvinella palmiformis]|uniref:ABC-type glutathione-S-conjugate transporter n=1 Tax=Paralvinella palmiformis TaxID=53620 RepID=A0AAD9MRU9_9ANNE|nr:hypothetical protein LSH36_1034g00008 [Paralvinella palmiformis]